MGANASSTSNAEAYINSFMTQVESFINVYCNYNFSDDYSGLNVDVKGVLKEIASNLAAIYVLNYDISGLSSAAEAELRMDVLRDAAFRGLNMLKDADKTDFINAA